MEKQIDQLADIVNNQTLERILDILIWPSAKRAKLLKAKLPIMV